MKKYKRPLLLIAIPTCCILVAFFFLFQPEVVSREKNSISQAILRDFQISVQTVGVIHAAKSHMISSQVKGNEGKIIYLIGDGEHVAQGDILVRLDPSPFEEEVERQKSQVDSLNAAVEAALQLTEWEKNEAKQIITTAEYTLKVAKLDLERLINGDGPLKLTQYTDDMDKAGGELKKFKAYATDLKALKQKGFDNPAEIIQAEEKVAQYNDQFIAAKRRYESFEKYVLPSMIESARAKVQNSELSLQQTKQASVHKIAKAHATLQQVKGKLRSVETALKQAHKQLEKTIISAPFPGLVIHYETYRDGQMRKPREGDTVIMNQPLLYLPDISQMVIKGDVREVDLHKLALGLKASILVEAYPEKEFQGNLSFIGALATRRGNQMRGEKYFQVTFTLNGGDKRLRPGMTARVIVLSADLKQVLSVPSAAVFHDGEHSFCYQYKNKTFHKAPVKIGRQNEDFIEIVEGLDKGDTVSLVEPEQS